MASNVPNAVTKSAPAERMTDDPIEEIETIRREFEAAENRKDPSVQIERRDPSEFVRMPPGRSAMSYEKANERLESLYAAGGFHVEWESDGIFASENLAVDSGRFTVAFDDGRHRKGKWLLVYRRDAAGRWRVIRDIYNYDEKSVER